MKTMTAEEIREKHLFKNGLSVTSINTRIGQAIHKSAIDAMHEFAEQQKPKWVKVSDRLPEPYRLLLCEGFISGYENSLKIACWYDSDDDSWMITGTDDSMVSVSHWLDLSALPTPPTDEK